MTTTNLCYPPVGPQAEESPLRLLKGILYKCIMQKKQEMYKTELKRSDIEISVLLLVEKIERYLLGFVAYDIY